MADRAYPGLSVRHRGSSELRSICTAGARDHSHRARNRLLCLHRRRPAIGQALECLGSDEPTTLSIARNLPNTYNDAGTGIVPGWMRAGTWNSSCSERRRGPRPLSAAYETTHVCVCVTVRHSDCERGLCLAKMSTGPSVVKIAPRERPNMPFPNGTTWQIGFRCRTGGAGLSHDQSRDSPTAP